MPRGRLTVPRRRPSPLAARLAPGLVTATLAVAIVLLAGANSAQPQGPQPCPAADAAPSAAAPPNPPLPTPGDSPPTPTAVLPSAAPVRTAGAPSIVEVRGEPYRYTYHVNGRPALVRGIGYNVAYRGWGWDCAARAARYHRDFAMMRAAGFDTLVGWDEGEFDDLTLGKAHQHGLGVMFPYDLPPTSDWSDPAVRQVHQQRVEALVRRYASHPALRMWGLGNEVLWKIDDVSSPQTLAFAEFFAALAERVHTLDPNHPVVYRDSEDTRVAPIRDALRERGLEQPWFIYGTDTFTFRLREILENWPTADFPVPLLVSEFGLVGYRRAERPGGLARMWDLVRQHHAYVLGGAVYAWTTDGIERTGGPFTDRDFGLVDGNGHPVDGALDVLRAVLHAPLP